VIIYHFFSIIKKTFIVFLFIFYKKSPPKTNLQTKPTSVNVKINIIYRTKIALLIVVNENESQ
jgi:hypothetical protein